MSTNTPQARRAERNRRAYLKRKTGQEELLVRLALGDAARLDAACAAAGMTRAGFCRTHLVPLAEAAAPRLAAIIAAGGLEKILASMPDHSTPELRAGAEFDALFGCGHEAPCSPSRR